MTEGKEMLGLSWHSRAGFDLVTPFPAGRASLPDGQTCCIKGTRKFNFKTGISQSGNLEKFSRIICSLVLLLFYIAYEVDVIVFSMLSGL